MADNDSLLQRLVKPHVWVQKDRSDFPTAMQQMGFTSVFDIVRLSKAAFARQLALFSDANADVAYDNALKYAALIARLYREYQTSSGTLQQLAQRSGIRALVPLGATYQRMFNENWDEFAKVGAIAANDSPVAYLTELRRFSLQLEATSEDPKRLLMDQRRPDLKDLLISQESTFTPRKSSAHLSGWQSSRQKQIHPSGTGRTELPLRTALQLLSSPMPTGAR
jgi:hypothetical protein